MRENLVQFSSKQEYQAQIITFVNNQYQNYKVSLNYFFLLLYYFNTIIIILYYYFRNITNCINKPYHSSIVSCQHSCTKRCKVIDSVSNETKTFWQYIFFSTNHLETHAICFIINKIYSNKRMAPNNKRQFLTPLKYLYT